MKYSLSRSEDAGSLCAGLLIGLSILIAVFAMQGSGYGQPWWILASPMLLVLGFALQRLVTAPRRSRRAARPEVSPRGSGRGHAR